jgi:tellurite resistance protein
MTARVQIVVEAKDAASGVLRGLTSQMGSFGSLLEEVTSENVSWGNAAQMATTMVVDGLKDSYKAFQDYAGQVRDLALVSGVGAEESSRLLQVLDDFQISAEDVTAATRVMTKQGLTPTIATLADLSDEYLSITDAQERNEFVLKNLGRAGLQWTNVLEKGGDALRAMSDEVSDNLILSDEQIEKAEEQRLAMDALADSWEGFKVQLGAGVGEMILAIEETKEVTERTREYAEAHDIVIRNQHDAQAINEIVREQMEQEAYWREYTTEIMERYNVKTEETNALLEVSAVNYKDLIGNIQNYQGAIDNYNETNDDLRAKEAELLQEREKTLAQLEQMQRWYGKGSRKAQEAAEKLEGIDAALQKNNSAFAENKARMDEWAAQAVYNFALARAGADGNISEIEGQILIDAGKALGLFDEKTADTMASVNRAFDTLDASNAEDVIQTLLDELEKLTTDPWIIEIVAVKSESTGGGGGGGGGGGKRSPIGNNPYLVNDTGVGIFDAANRESATGNMSIAPSLNSGQINYFYGPTTLQINAENEADLLETRL